MRHRRRARRQSPLRFFILLIPIVLGVIAGIKLLKTEHTGHYEVETRGITNVLTVEKDGSLINTLTDNRVEDYHNNTEYETYIRDLVDGFNADHGGDQVSVKSIKTDKDKTTAVIRFSDYTAFSGFTGYQVFFGTIEEAIASGIDMAVELFVPGEETSGKPGIMASELKNPDKTHIIVTNVLSGEGLLVESFANIRYLHNARSVGKKLAAPDEDSTAYIVW